MKTRFKINDLVKYTDSKGKETLVIVTAGRAGPFSAWDIEAMFPNGRVFWVPTGQCEHADR